MAFAFGWTAGDVDIAQSRFPRVKVTLASSLLVRRRLKALSLVVSKLQSAFITNNTNKVSPQKTKSFCPPLLLSLLIEIHREKKGLITLSLFL